MPGMQLVSAAGLATQTPKRKLGTGGRESWTALLYKSPNPSIASPLPLHCLFIASPLRCRCASLPAAAYPFISGYFKPHFEPAMWAAKDNSTNPMLPPADPVNHVWRSETYVPFSFMVTATRDQRIVQTVTECATACMQNVTCYAYTYCPTENTQG